MTNGIPDNLSITENSLLRIISNYYDAISVMSQYPECFEAYKLLIQKKRNIANLQGGGLTVDSSQQEGSMYIGISSASK